MPRGVPQCCQNDLGFQVHVGLLKIEPHRRKPSAKLGPAIRAARHNSGMPAKPQRLRVPAEQLRDGEPQRHVRWPAKGKGAVSRELKQPVAERDGSFF